MKALVVVALLILLGSGRAEALTAQQAHSLPVAELARIVLGEASADIVDVDRPTWPTCYGFCPPLTAADIADRATVPPLKFGLTFYYQPKAVNDLNWNGLCSVQTVKVTYNDADQFQRLEQLTRYSAPTGMKRQPLPAGGDYDKRQREGDAECAKLTNVKSFFYAADAPAALFALVGITLFRDAAGSPSPLGFTFTCEESIAFVKDCAGPDHRVEILSAIEASRVGQVDQVSCLQNDYTIPRFSDPACYRISMKYEGESVSLEIKGILSQPQLVALHYSHGRVIY